MKFLKENWVWIVVPIVVVLIGLFVLIRLTSTDAATPFDYAL